MKLTLIRHGKTKGNEEHRYIGKQTDEPLSEVGRQEIVEAVQKGRYPALKKDDLLVAGPMQRTRQTAGIIYPGVPYRTMDAFREIDFGAFEGHTWQELSGDARYQAWIDSNGALPFPEGEDRDSYTRRIMEAFDTLVNEVTNATVEKTEESCGQIVLVTHGGVIMAILCEIGSGRYYDYMCENGSGFSCELKHTADGKIQAEAVRRLPGC